MSVFKYLVLFLLVISCNSPESVSNIKKEEYRPEKRFIGNNQKDSYRDVETKISNHDCFFLSYWHGMTKREVRDVTEYLIRNNEMLSLYDYSKSVEYANNVKFSISTERKDYHGPMDFEGNTLNSIAITLDYYEKPFQELVRFYKTKYGAPISTFIGKGKSQKYLKMGYGYMNMVRHKGYFQYVFLRGRTRVVLEFQPITQLCQNKFIRITYIDENAYQDKIIEIERYSKEKKLREKKKIKKSFDNI